MIERRRGAIVTMASTAGRVPLVGPSAAYAAAKAGVIMYTRYLAAEVGKHGIRANCISPGTVLTERLQGVMPEERRQQMAAMTALGRLGTPEDIALATLFLASDASSWLTGVTLDVNGGAVMIDRARRPRREMDGVEMDGQQDKREGTRASDAERERTAEALNQHFLAGRLTAAEYDERLSVAYAARTREDLQGLLADLPPLSEPEAREQPSGPWWRRLHPAVAVFALIATSWLVASLFGGGHPHGFFPLWPLLIWGFVLFRWGPWRLRQRR